ncbi:hypothetical protein D3C75_155360 [compost metagenome]
MIAAQFFILSCHAGSAVVQVTDTQVLTTQRHHWTGAEAEAFRTQNCRFHDIHTGFQATIHLQANFMAQAVGHQRLLGFHQAQFPRTAGVFH